MGLSVVWPYSEHSSCGRLSPHLGIVAAVPNGDLDAMKTPLKINETHAVGRCKYVVSYYTAKKHNDGSEFYDIAIFKSLKRKNAFVQELVAANGGINR